MYSISSTICPTIAETPQISPNGRLSRNSCNSADRTMITEEYRSMSSIDADISTCRNVGTKIDWSSQRFRHCLYFGRSVPGQLHRTRLDALASCWLFRGFYNYLFVFTIVLSSFVFLLYLSPPRPPLCVFPPDLFAFRFCSPRPSVHVLSFFVRIGTSLLDVHANGERHVLNAFPAIDP